ncbi:hypothetical protein LTR17_021866 [Elasticomyces elasticus]|nr:hypothetical protein LTR17_021866 [Elasticomyces elasticus]
MYAPGSPYAEGANTTQDVVSQIATDFIFRCTSGLVANLTSTLLNVPVWQYVFDAQVPSNTLEEYPDLGVYHASEVSLLFGTYPRENSTEVEAKLNRSVQKQLADFVKNPEQGPGREQWPQAWEDLDAVCLQYNDFYLSTLPALTRMNSSQSNGSSTGASDNIDSVVPNAANHLGSSAIWIGASLLGIAALLWHTLRSLGHCISNDTCTLGPAILRMYAAASQRLRRFAHLLANLQSGPIHSILGNV